MGQMKQQEPRTLKVGDELMTFTREVTESKMVEFERVVWDRGRNSHSDPEEAKRDGLTKPLASGQNQMAFLHELLERNFGDAWVYGGKISVRNIHPVYGGDIITPHGTVTEISEVDGKPCVTVQIWCENQNGQKTSAGTAYAGQPSASQSWLQPITEKIS
jgi:acyl dehydratase